MIFPPSRGCAHALIPLVVLCGAFAQSTPACEFSFCDLSVEQRILPNLPIPPRISNETAERKEARRHDLEALKKRLAQRASLRQEAWKAEEGSSATLTAIHNLVENGKLGFAFIIDASGTYRLEISAPKGPDLGPYTIGIDQEPPGRIDPWAERNTSCIWIPMDRNFHLSKGEHLLFIGQLSPQDPPIRLMSFRLKPVPPAR